MRASEQAEGAPACAEAVPEEPPVVEALGNTEPDYDAKTCTQFVMLGLDDQTPAPAPSSSTVPEWENGTQCNKCVHTMGKDHAPLFGYVFNRRHHCRRCLKSFCGYCSNNFYQIEPDGPVERICDYCLEEMEGALAPNKSQ